MSSVYNEELADESPEAHFEEDEQWFQGQDKDQEEQKEEDAHPSTNQVSVADSPLTFSYRCKLEEALEVRDIQYLAELVFEIKSLKMDDKLSDLISQAEDIIYDD